MQCVIYPFSADKRLNENEWKKEKNGHNENRLYTNKSINKNYSGWRHGEDLKTFSHTYGVRQSVRTSRTPCQVEIPTL